MSLYSLGSYAVRTYPKFLESDPMMLDLIQCCVSSLAIPPNHNLSVSDWRAKEFVKLQALFTLSLVPSALDLYWKGIRLLLSSVVPELSPTISSVSSHFWNSGCDQSDSWKFITAQDIDNVLRLVVQLADGGAELSESKALIRAKEKKNKKQTGVELIQISQTEVQNALLKLECLCEVRDFLFGF